MSSYEQKEWMVEIQKVRVLLLGIAFLLTLLFITLISLTYFHFLQLQEWSQLMNCKIETLEKNVLNLQQSLELKENSGSFSGKKFSDSFSKYQNPISSFFESVGQYTMWSIKSSLQFVSSMMDTFSKGKE